MKAKGNRPCKASEDHHGGKVEGQAGLRDRTLCEACFYSSGLSRTVLFVRCQHCDHDSTLGVCVCVVGVPSKGMQWSRYALLGTCARVPDLQIGGYWERGALMVASRKTCQHGVEAEGLLPRWLGHCDNMFVVYRFTWGKTVACL